MTAITSTQMTTAAPAKDNDLSDTVLLDKPFNLLRSYALTSLVVMLIIGGLWAAIFSSYLADSVLQRDAEVSQAFLQSLTEVEGGPEVFRLGSQDSSSQLQAQIYDSQIYDLPELVDHIATMPGVIRANLFAGNGVVLWSTKADLIGQQFPSNHELKESLQGEIVFELTDVKEEQKAEYLEFGSEISGLVENYLPIWDVENNEVVAVVEIYKAPKSLFDAMESARNLVWISVAGTTLFLYTTLFWIVYRASHVIRSQQKRLVESETMVAVGEMASAIAHSIRNPLAAIRSGAELSGETSVEPIVRETANDIIGEIDRVEQWVRELLTYSRPEGTTQFNLVDVDEILEKCLEGCQYLMKCHEVQLICDLSQDVPAVKGDAGLLRQMFNSILANALESMPNGGSLNINVDSVQQKKLIQISISDSGYGIPEDRLATIFEAGLTTKPHGFGIGLLMVKRIVDRHGGNISFSSQVGKGTTAWLVFPVA